MDNVIGFICKNSLETPKFFEQFCIDNKDVIDTKNLDECTATLKDGTHIVPIYAGQHKRIVDQIILADDSKMRVKDLLNNFYYEFSDAYEEKYQVQEYIYEDLC